MSDETFTITPERLIFAIGGDGHVELGKGVTLDEASAAFWKQVNARGLADRAALVERVVEACANVGFDLAWHRADTPHGIPHGWSYYAGAMETGAAIRALDRKKLLEGT